MGQTSMPSSFPDIVDDTDTNVRVWIVQTVDIVNDEQTILECSVWLLGTTAFALEGRSA